MSPVANFGAGPYGMLFWTVAACSTRAAACLLLSCSLQQAEYVLVKVCFLHIGRQAYTGMCNIPAYVYMYTVYKTLYIYLFKVQHYMQSNLHDIVLFKVNKSIHNVAHPIYDGTQYVIVNLRMLR